MLPGKIFGKGRFSMEVENGKAIEPSCFMGMKHDDEKPKVPLIISTFEHAMYEFKESGEVIVDISILDKMEDALQEMEIDFKKRIDFPFTGTYQLIMGDQ